MWQPELPRRVTASAISGSRAESKESRSSSSWCPSPEVTPDDDLARRVVEAYERGLGKAFRPRIVTRVGDLARDRSQR